MRRFGSHTGAASAAEFALILPAALLLLFGIIDVGRYVWQLNQYEKAVQMGARYAVATKVLSVPLRQADFASATLPFCTGKTAALGAGETICAEAMRPLVCTSTKCECLAGGGFCGEAKDSTTFDSTQFSNIVSRMAVVTPRFQLANVRVEYAGSGIGYVGDPAVSSSCTAGSTDAACQLPDIAPIVTVRLVGLTYRPITLGPLEYNIPYPPFSYSLTMEDGDGTVAS